MLIFIRKPLPLYQFQNFKNIKVLKPDDKTNGDEAD